MDVGVMLAELIPQVPSNVFTKWLSKRVSITWLDSEDDRLGMTRFEEGNAELVRRRRLKLDPGEITIGLHPRLVDEPDLLIQKFTVANDQIIFHVKAQIIGMSILNEMITRFQG